MCLKDLLSSEELLSHTRTEAHGKSTDGNREFREGDHGLKNISIKFMFMFERQCPLVVIVVTGEARNSTSMSAVIREPVMDQEKWTRGNKGVA